MTDTHAPAGTPLVELRDIKVSFGGLHAVDGVSMALHPGEVMAVVGGNGAGKSTLMHTIAGAHPADSGQILVNGSPVTIANPRDARAHGIEVIYQRLALADNIDAAGNLFLGRELRTPTGALDDSAMASATATPSRPGSMPTIWRTRTSLPKCPVRAMPLGPAGLNPTNVFRTTGMAFWGSLNEMSKSLNITSNAGSPLSLSPTMLPLVPK